MNYSKLMKCDIANGEGWRVTLWCTGCLRKCPNCFNEEAQDPKFGNKFDDEAKEKIFKELASEQCDGLSLMGGEPLSRLSDNRKTIINLCKEVKERFPNRNIWIWSGYTFEEISSNTEMTGILDYVDVLVDGPFLIEKKDLSTPFRGSTNQRVLDIAKWRETGKLVELY